MHEPTIETAIPLGRSVQLPPPERDSLRQKEPQWPSWSATLRAQSGLSPSCVSTHPTGLLPSTGVTRLLRYYEPLRLPAAPTGTYEFAPRLGSTQAAGSPRFPGQSFGTRCPQPPRQARGLLVPITSPTVTGFITSGRLATCKSVTRPNRVCLRCGSHLRHGKASTPRLLRTPLPRLHAKWAITWWAPFIPRD